MATVTLSGVRKVYPNGHVAVQAADIEARDGELLVLVGPSGCGKSTLLRLIAGLEEVSAGRIAVGQRDVTQMAPRDRDIAMVFQSYALYPHMNVEQNLGFGLKLRGIAPEEARRRVMEAARMLDLASVLQRVPKELSGGQRQRVALGRALVRQPQVFLLDEPLSNLDAKLRGVMRAEIARLHRTLATTMIYVTHDQIEAMTLGQRIAVMDAGVVQQIDAPMRIYQRPANLFVAGFLGNPAMNLLRGRAQLQEQPALQAADARLPLPQELVAALRGEEREIVLGIRPEDLHVAQPDAPASELSVIVELVEAVGNEAFVHTRLGAWTLIIRTAPEALPQPGAQLRLYAPWHKIHCFDAASGARIEDGYRNDFFRNPISGAFNSAASGSAGSL
jgi:multiple sugar transport system ATP-binding protein